MPFTVNSWRMRKVAFWAIRSFALTFSAVTIRLQLGASFAAGQRFEDFYWMLSWTCWIPNLFVAEWLIRRRTSA